MKEKYFNVGDKKFRLFIREEEIKRRTRDLAERINKDYAGKDPVFLVTLKGAIFFAADLLRMIEVDNKVETVRAKSYGDAMESGGLYIEIGDINIAGKEVVVIEDIVDTGKTIKTLIEQLKLLKPANIEIAAFLLKPKKLKEKVRVKYVGLEIPPNFVIGYGLDYAERGRHLPDIYIYDK